MPAKSKAQLRWVNSPEGMKALGLRGVEEWDIASRGKKLPERVAKKKKKLGNTKTKGRAVRRDTSALKLARRLVKSLEKVNKVK